MGLRLAVQDKLRARMAARDVPAVAALLDAGRGMRVLDVGGGTGMVAELVAPQCTVFVLEPDARKVAHGHLERPRFGFIEAGAEQLPFPDHHFERVLALLSFHHFPRAVQGPALREMRRVLVPGGRLVMHEFSPTVAPGRWVGWVERRLLRQEVAFHEPAALTAMLQDAGFAPPVVRPASRGYLLAATPQ